MTSLGNRQIHELRLSQVCFRYGDGPLVLDSVTMEIPMGRIFHVTGPTGHGQSTFLKVLACLLEPTSGHIFVNGLNATEMSFEEFLPYRLELGYTFEVGGLLSNRTLMENLALPQLYHDVASPELIHERITSLAKRFRFDGFLERRPAMVSSGLRKLVATLRPIILKPCVVVMDDPFAGLDPETARELAKYVSELREAGEIKTVCLTSRDETWPGRLGAEPLWIESGDVSIGGRDFGEEKGAS